MQTENKIELKPNPKCKDCLGRGYLRIIRPDLNPNKFREIRPCHCVKAVIEEKKLESVKESRQFLI